MLSGRLYNVAGAHSECYAHLDWSFSLIYILQTHERRLKGFKNHDEVPDYDVC